MRRKSKIPAPVCPGPLLVFLISLAFYAAYFSIKINEDFFTYVSDLLPVFAALMAVVAGYYACKTLGIKSPQGKATFFLSMGILLWFIGEVWWGYLEIIKKVPVDELIATQADIFWIAGYIPLFIGICFGVKAIKDLVCRKAILLSGIVTLLILIIGIKTFFYEVVIDTETALFEKIVTILYPAGDIILLAGILFVLFALMGTHTGRVWEYYLLGLGVFAISDIIFSFLSWNGLYYGATHGLMVISCVADLGWIAGYLLLAAGFYYQRTILEGR